MLRSILVLTLLAGCSSITPILDYTPEYIIYKDVVNTAQEYVGMDERKHRGELRDFMGVDPYRIEWCAAFVNSVLNNSGISGSESVSNHPLTARSFLNWGEKVEGEPMTGDVIVFPRGRYGWQGHVGFYIDTVLINDIEYYIILGGNQSDKVSYEYYRSSTAIDIRRVSIENDA